MPKVTMRVNGRDVSGEVEGRTLLVEFLREGLGMTGTHVGCDTSQCGACTVHVNGLQVKSCTTFAMDVDGAEITTIEGVAAADGTLSTLQQAFQDHHGLQCGFCTPGMVMAAAALLGEPQADRGRDPPPPGRQHLPLHGLPQHRQGDHGRQRSGRQRHRSRIRSGIMGLRCAVEAPHEGGIGCRKTGSALPRSGARTCGS